jgi:hypothetical protein
MVTALRHLTVTLDATATSARRLLHVHKRSHRLTANRARQKLVCPAPHPHSRRQPHTYAPLWFASTLPCCFSNPRALCCAVLPSRPAAGTSRVLQRPSNDPPILTTIQTTVELPMPQKQAVCAPAPASTLLRSLCGVLLLGDQQAAQPANTPHGAPHRPTGSTRMTPGGGGGGRGPGAQGGKADGQGMAPGGIQAPSQWHAGAGCCS